VFVFLYDMEGRGDYINIPSKMKHTKDEVIKGTSDNPTTTNFLNAVTLENRFNHNTFLPFDDRTSPSSDNNFITAMMMSNQRDNGVRPGIPYFYQGMMQQQQNLLAQENAQRSFPAQPNYQGSTSGGYPPQLFQFPMHPPPLYPFPSPYMSPYGPSQFPPSAKVALFPPGPLNEPIALLPPVPDDTKARVFYRNLFHTIHGKFGVLDGPNWEGCRVYISDSVGYSGNAKRFKRRPEKGEKALLLECAVLDPKEQPINATCLACKDYFETQKYFKTNQECIGKIMLVKNNAPISVEGGQFKILVKMMCCCVHHSVDYFVFELNLTSTLSNRKLYSAKVSLNVKQWRKSNQKKEECVLLLE